MIKSNKQIVTAFSPAKLIITGEHSAVYGHPALVSSLDRGVRVTLSALDQNSSRQTRLYEDFYQNVFDIFAKKFLFTAKSTLNGGWLAQNLAIATEFEVPVGCGLGSSAALSHAFFRALFEWYKIDLSDEEMIEMVQESEKLTHGNPSGVDTMAVVKGGLLYFQKTDSGLRSQSLDIVSDHQVKFLLINSGKPAETTGEMVELVKEKVDEGKKYKDLIIEIGELTENFVSSLSQGELDKAIIKENHSLLNKLGVVGQKANKIVQDIEKIGGVAKTSGAGGRKSGSGMILSFHDDFDQLTKYAENNSLESYEVGIL